MCATPAVHGCGVQLEVPNESAAFGVVGQRDRSGYCFQNPVHQWLDHVRHAIGVLQLDGNRRDNQNGASCHIRAAGQSKWNDRLAFTLSRVTPSVTWEQSRMEKRAGRERG